MCANAVTASLDKKKWVGHQFDVDQKTVTDILVNVKFNLDELINPEQLNATKLKLQNKDDNKCAQFRLEVKSMTKTDWYKGRRINEYLVGKDAHCLYVEWMTDNGRRLH